MRNRLCGWGCGLAVLALVGSGATGCSTERGSLAVIAVDAPVALADQPVHIRIDGLSPGEQVTVGARAVDARGEQWRAQATFRADAHGLVVLDTATPKSGGTYRNADGMGLFWSMNPQTGDAERTFFVPPDAPRSSYQVVLTAAVSGRALVSRTLTRSWSGTGVTSRELTLAADGVSGALFLPPLGTLRHPAVLVFGGSEGGNALTPTAALLASHGYPALALGYFALPGLPKTLSGIPLEYFAAAGRLLAAQPGVDPEHVLVLGYSRGSEAALLLADDYPDLVHGALVYSPSADVHIGFPDNGIPAWTKNDKAVAEGPIPLARVSGPVLAIAGADDQLWSSGVWAQEIVKALDTAHNPHPHRALIFTNAGHGVGTHPYLAAGTRPVSPSMGVQFDEGGTRAGNAAARQEGWPQVLALLASLTR
ncbi:acyl-CoA thioesterase/bile acid-CoA:amino acid N-acyltransferase family protein [Embleya scabrispora]|uniref:acyl-CoA thioesterase/bile acid-CoA:amino acid N-acyltransferase family protein n=1 Tax=Embleya scabrispora TaxID=159449 RepID=UPI000D0E9487|nr:acyl-CoA thioesterase/bile acid-CoA:amino acid N-acyltransferase family protein [Embleya scabrispora]MYS78837.1 hypothetical protein [Streptomyces sp. SID5474]